MDSVQKWKAGDVALVRLDRETEIRVMFTNDGWRGVKGSYYDLNLSARPLVVIDPEDREQVEALRDLYDAAVIRMNNDPDPRDVTPDQRTTAMQSAFLTLANPTPPIEEPTGYGAVVEDADGQLWIHLEQGVWYCVRHGREDWAGVKAVRVLSEGVPVEAKS